jgi:pyruvate ferredoxin oxidoreductase gamma subunit
MIEIRIHGRGGQGVKKSAQLIARACFLKGYHTQDFALYGAERRGAPVTSFVRVSEKDIGTRGYVFEPDYVIILDESVSEETCLKGKGKKTKVVVNGSGFCNVDASKSAMKHLGRNVPNIALLGAFAKVSKLFTLQDLKKAVEAELGKKGKDIVNKNMLAAKECYDTVRC